MLWMQNSLKTLIVTTMEWSKGMKTLTRIKVNKICLYYDEVLYIADTCICDECLEVITKTDDEFDEDANLRFFRV